MKVNGYQCDGCGYYDPGRPGDQREPGPFLPLDWWGGDKLCFCTRCKVKVRNGILREDS